MSIPGILLFIVILSGYFIITYNSSKKHISIVKHSPSLN